MVWDIGVWFYTVGQYRIQQLDIIPSSNKIVSITKYTLSLYRQYASLFRNTLVYSEMRQPYQASLLFLISYLLDRMVCTPRGLIPISFYRTVEMGYPIEYSISFRPLIITTVLDYYYLNRKNDFNSLNKIVNQNK